MILGTAMAIAYLVNAIPAHAESVDGDPSVTGTVIQVSSRVGDLPARGSCPKYDSLIRREVGKYRNSRQLYQLAHVVMYIESRCNPRARSRVGARGLMQVMPATARSIGYRGGRNGLYDARTSIKYGIKYLDYCLNLARGDFRKAGACYNAGPRRVNYSYSRLPRETKGYVTLISRHTGARHQSRERQI